MSLYHQRVLIKRILQGLGIETVDGAAEILSHKNNPVRTEVANTVDLETTSSVCDFKEYSRLLKRENQKFPIKIDA